MSRLFQRSILRLHRNDSGNIGILLLLTIWALVAMIGMVWNAAEFATRKQHAQLAVDSSAHSAIEWSSRTTNLISASNMLIGENASAESILRAIPPTINGLTSRLNREIQDINRLLGQSQQTQTQNQNNPNPIDPGAEARLSLLLRVLPQLLAELKTEQALAQPFILTGSAGLSITPATELARRRGEIFEYQQEIVALTPGVIEEQRAPLEKFYKCDLTFANPGDVNAVSGQSDRFSPPVKEVNQVNVEGVQMPGTAIPDPDDGDVWVNGGTWGWINDPPLRRFLVDRTWRDQKGLEALLKPVDDERREFSQWVEQLLRIPPNAWGPSTDPTIIQAITNGFNSAADQVRRMHLVEPFAIDLWHNSVWSALDAMLRELGNTPQIAFVTYDRYPVPEWAKAGMYQDAYNYVYNDVYGRNHNRLWWRRYHEVLNQLLKQKVPQGQAVPQARAKADEFATRIATAGAIIIATDAATQWINRTWPYEMEPPQSPMPPAVGPKKEDRIQYLTLVGAAKTTDDTKVRITLPRLFNAAPDKPMVVFAQAENFNWMEFNGSYGAGDRYDRHDPPAPWRVSTIGGWNWQSRLSLSDAIGPALENNPQLRSFFDDAGVRYDPEVIDEITLH